MARVSVYNKILYVTRQHGAKCARNMCVELSGCDEMQSTQRVLRLLAARLVLFFEVFAPGICPLTSAYGKKA
jgi:hypothetical protein